MSEKLVIWNGRFPESMVNRVKDIAWHRRWTQTAVVKEALEQYLNAVPADKREQAPEPESVPEPVDFAKWLSARTGKPPSVSRAQVKAGRVKVNGKVWDQPQILPSYLDGHQEILVDGRVV